MFVRHCMRLVFLFQNWLQLIELYTGVFGWQMCHTLKLLFNIKIKKYIHPLSWSHVSNQEWKFNPVLTLSGEKLRLFTLRPRFCINIAHLACLQFVSWWMLMLPVISGMGTPVHTQTAWLSNLPLCITNSGYSGYRI